MLRGIQAGRGVAALLVVLCHCERALSLPQYIGHMPLHGLAAFGHAGVDFFFVLSGFIIATVHHGDLGHPWALSRYAGRRISRILPPYWIVTLATVALAIVGHGWDGVPSPGHFVASLLLLPHNEEPILGVAWTLEREMLFYVLFGLAILDRRLAAVIVAVWVGLSAASVLLPGIALGGWAAGPYDLLFSVGLITAWPTRRLDPRRPRLLALAGAVVFLGAGILEDAGLLPHEALQSRLVYGFASSVIILGLTTAERAGRLHVGRALDLLGAASYSIYLVHLMALTLTARALMEAGLIGQMPGWLTMTIATTVGVTAGIAFHMAVERPVSAAARRLAARWLPDHSAPDRIKAQAALTAKPTRLA